MAEFSLYPACRSQTKKLPIVYNPLNQLNPQEFPLGLHLDFRHLDHLGLSLLGYVLGVIVTTTPNQHVLNSNGPIFQEESMSTMQIKLNIGPQQQNFPKWLAKAASELYARN